MTQRVLLIDADLERRTLAALDADRNEGGLIDVAVGRRMLSEVTIRDRETGIHLASFVSPDSRRDRRITEADIKRAFDQTKRFDMVIVAASGIRQQSRHALFADLVDHILLVAAADQQDTSTIEQFASQLGPDAQKIRGAILTGADTVPHVETGQIAVRIIAQRGGPGTARSPAARKSRNRPGDRCRHADPQRAPGCRISAGVDLFSPVREPLHRAGGHGRRQPGQSNQLFAAVPGAGDVVPEPRSRPPAGSGSAGFDHNAAVVRVVRCHLLGTVALRPAICFYSGDVGLAAMALLLPKNIRHFSDVMAVVVLIVLAACYLGVFLAA